MTKRKKEIKLTTNAGFKHRLSRTCVPAIGSLMSSRTMGVAQVLDICEVLAEDYDLFTKLKACACGAENVIRHVDAKRRDDRPDYVLAIKLNTSEGVKWALYEHTTYDRIGEVFRRTWWDEDDTPTFNEVNKGGKMVWTKCLS